MPFGEYDSLEDCVSKNQDKDNPQAFCAAIKKQAEGETDRSGFKKENYFEYDVPVTKHYFETYKTESGVEKKRFMVEGTAIHETISRNDVWYVAEELKPSAKTLIGAPILKDHRNEVDSIAGIVRDSYWNETNKSIPFKAEIMDQSCIEKFQDGRLSKVSMGTHFTSETFEEIDGRRVSRPTGLTFVELTLTAIPGIPGAGVSNTFYESYKKFKEGSNMTTKKKEQEPPIPPVAGPEPNAGGELQQILQAVQQMQAQLTSLDQRVVALEGGGGGEPAVPPMESAGKLLAENLKEGFSEVLKELKSHNVNTTGKGKSTEAGDPVHDGVERFETDKGVREKIPGVGTFVHEKTSGNMSEFYLIPERK